MLTPTAARGSVVWNMAAFVFFIALYLGLSAWEHAGPIDSWRFLRAVERGDLLTIDRMLQHEGFFAPAPGRPDETWETDSRKRVAIEHAIIAGQVPVLGYLLRNPAFHKPGTGLSLWSVAARCGSTSIMRALLDLGERPATASLSHVLTDCTAYSLHLQADGTLIPEEKRVAALDFLIAHGADARAHAGAILTAAFRSDLFQVGQMLVARGTSIRALEQEGSHAFLTEVLAETMLKPEAKRRWVEFLLDQGSDPGRPDREGRKPADLIRDLALRQPHEAHAAIASRLERNPQEHR